jgi:1,4-alpha-glucan branching enzyme
MKLFLTFFCCMLLAVARPQLLSWTPQFPTDADNLTITVDANFGNKGLLNQTVTDVYVHTGVITNLSTGSGNWRYVKFNQDFNQPNPALQATSLGNNKWQFTVNNIRDYYGVPAGETIKNISILFRSGNGSKKQANTDGSDMYIPIFPAGEKHIQFTQPYLQPTFQLSQDPITADVGVQVPLKAVATDAAGTLNLYFNGTKVSGPVTGTNTIIGSVAASAKGNQQLVAEYIIGGISYYDTINYYLRKENTIAALPAGVREGINYNANCTSVTLVLYAPYKDHVDVVGEFPGSNWLPNANYQMNKTPDGNYYWVTIEGLTPGLEYAYNYQVDDNIFIADPYAEKVLDPDNDKYIPAVTYPNLKAYPTNANVSGGKNGFVSILQTCAPAYNWQVKDFVKPESKNLIVYELLVRDFHERKNYQTLIDSFSYFKKMGINAIELMPVNEFAGNESWGYNPKFYCALDKAYGTKDKFKEFIDLCHKNGIAVILDVVYNQMDAYGTPQGKMYWDNSGKPAANSPWFNQSAPHPYNVFEDLNHTSTATQYLVERAMEYWISEYKIDGYRMDLAKGFTQTVTNESTVENYDASRVANLERYYDFIISKYPTTYMILEFLGQQRAEEQEYANHGFMLWGNSNQSYNWATKGYVAGVELNCNGNKETSNPNFSKIVYNSSEEAFSKPANMGYMESHDEERLMFRNLNCGNLAGTYNVRSLNVALARQAAAAAVFFTVPGPKMFWQFGERGYDLSLVYGGSNVANKPPHWEYMADANRLKLFDSYSKLISLRLSNPTVFNNTMFSYDFYDGGGLVKRFQIADPNSNGLKITVIANLDVTEQTRTVYFQTAGDWYNYLSNGTGSGINGTTGEKFSLGATDYGLTLQPGEYHVFVSHPANTYMFIGNGDWDNASNWTYGKVPPTPLPSGSQIIVSPQSGGECILKKEQRISTGAILTVSPGRYFTVPGVTQN